jgi:hypothetical protein
VTVSVCVGSVFSDWFAVVVEIVAQDLRELGGYVWVEVVAVLFGTGPITVRVEAW